MEAYDFHFGLLRLLDKLSPSELELFSKIICNIVGHPNDPKFRQIKVAKVPETLLDALFFIKFQRKVHQMEAKICFHHDDDPVDESGPWNMIREAKKIIQGLQKRAKANLDARKEAAEKIAKERQRWSEQAEKVKNEWRERQIEKQYMSQFPTIKKAVPKKEELVKAVNVYDLSNAKETY